MTSQQIITLELSKKLQDTGIVEDFIFEIDTKNFVLYLNHVYDNVRIIWHYNKNWTLMKNHCQKECKRKGVNDSHIALIEDNIDLNYNTVTITQESNKNENNKNGRRKEESTEEKDTDEEITQFLFSYVENYIKLLFKDQFGKLFAYVRINEDHYEIMSLTSHKFERYLFKIFYESEYKIVLSKEDRNQIVDYLQSKTEFNGIVKNLELRVAKTQEDDHTFYYDLTNSEGSAVKITSDGWILEKTPPILFRRYTSQSSQVNPSLLTVKNMHDSNILDKFIDLLNVEDKDTKLLLKCYIISLFIPDIAKPILMLHGEHGSAKTTLQELIKMLVDPSSVKTLIFPRDINELIQKLSHNYISYFDNVSTIKEWISDALCRGVTGSGFSKRQLYTDDDDIIYFFLRCIGFNGINLGATKADLLDRGIIIQLERIHKKKGRNKEDIWNEFNVIKPELLGYILDILVKVLQVKRDGGVRMPDGHNRMADWEEYSEIISRCLGYPENEFLRVYQENINIKIDEAIEASPLSMAVMEFMVDNVDWKDNIIYKEEWSGTSTELSSELDAIAENKLKIDIKKMKYWPKSPNYLSRRLNEVKTNLREKGFVIETGTKNAKGNRIIKIRKVSSISSYCQEYENHAQNPQKSLDDTLDDTTNISSNNNDENHAQKTGFRRYGDMDDTIHSKIEAGLFTNPLISKSDRSYF